MKILNLKFIKKLYNYIKNVYIYCHVTSYHAVPSSTTYYYVTSYHTFRPPYCHVISYCNVTLHHIILSPSSTTNCHVTSTLLGKLTKRILPDNSPVTNATNFDSYFYIKTSSIIDTLPRPCIPPISSLIYSFSTFSLQTIININNILLTVISTCKLDPIPLCLLHSLSSLLSPFYKKLSIAH